MLSLPPGWIAVGNVLVPPTVNATGSKLALHNMLAAFTSPERLLVRQGNGYRCDTCGVSDLTDATRRLLLYSPPQVLTLHLKV